MASNQWLFFANSTVDANLSEQKLPSTTQAPFPKDAAAPAKEIIEIFIFLRDQSRWVDCVVSGNRHATLEILFASDSMSSLEGSISDAIGASGASLLSSVDEYVGRPDSTFPVTTRSLGASK